MRARAILIEANALSVFELKCLRCSHLAVVVVNGRLISF